MYTANKTPVYFPMDQSERTSYRKVNELLPQHLYAELEQLIQKAVQAVPERSPEQDLAAEYFSARRHEAALIQGPRGAGKTTVLVNLPLYLREKNRQVFDAVHVLKPVDPTQLEDEDDLFLNVIVAAILSDESLAAAQERHDAKRHTLYQRLQDLGQALEDRQTQKRDVGIDQLRAFMGAHHMAVAVHKFFGAALDLLGKKLLVLPIDDVDTTLHRAFENLEVVRRYLGSPLVLPLICGELDLYHEVIWRDFYRRLTKDSARAVSVDDDVNRARRLAVEYERKLLPVQSRLEVPSVQDYLGDPNIRLLPASQGSQTDLLSLDLLNGWVTALIQGPVNGLENSELPVPVLVPTVRALAQLIKRVEAHVQPLYQRLKSMNAAGSALGVRRALQMPELNPAAMESFGSAQRVVRSTVKRDTRSAYSAFAVEQRKTTSPASGPDAVATPTPSRPTLDELAGDWHGPLREHFLHEPDAGAACLVLLANEHWRPANTLQRTDNGAARLSVLATPLFQPQTHLQPGVLDHLNKSDHLSPWRSALQGCLPDDWRGRLPTKAILAFVTPEAGRAVAHRSYRQSDNDIEDDKRRQRFNLLVDLLLHRSYYSVNKQAPLILTGRILELVVTSMVREVDIGDVERLLAQAPFHSAAAVAQTQFASAIADDSDPDDNVPDGLSDEEQQDRDQAISMLVADISAWRAAQGLQGLHLSPWLVFNALNKTLNKAWHFNKPLGAIDRVAGATEVAWRARLAFNSLWAAFGSFEKGPLFELQPIVSTVNIGPGGTFEKSELYVQNIAPFYGEEPNVQLFGQTCRSVTYFLGTHPLRTWVLELPVPQLAAKAQGEAKRPPASPDPAALEREARMWLRVELGGDKKNRLGEVDVYKLLKLFPKTVVALRNIEIRLKREHPGAPDVHALLAKVIAKRSTEA